MEPANRPFCGFSQRFLHATSGDVAVAGVDARLDPAGVRQAIGYLPENPPGHNDARVDEYLSFRRRHLKGIGRDTRRRETIVASKPAS